MAILHLQSGDGKTGGIASYIARLTSSVVPGVKSFVTVNTAFEDEVKIQAFYPNASPIQFSAEYSSVSFLVSVISLVKIIREQSIDILHAHALRAGLLACCTSRFVKMPFVYTNHGVRFVQISNRIKRLIWRYLEYCVIRTADVIVCVRQHDRNVLLTQWPFLKDKVQVINTRIDAVAARHGEPNSAEPLFVGCGSLIGVKRVDRFVDWCCAISLTGIKGRYMWVGDGVLADELQRYAHRRNVQIEWVGNLDRAGVDEVLRRAHFLFLTSDFEVLPLVVLEALSFGTPVVASEFPGVRDIITDDDTGIIVDTDTSSLDVAHRVVARLSDSQRYLAMRRNAERLFRERYSGSDIMRGEYAMVHSSLVT